MANVFEEYAFVADVDDYVTLYPDRTDHRSGWCRRWWWPGARASR